MWKLILASVIVFLGGRAFANPQVRYLCNDKLDTLTLQADSEVWFAVGQETTASLNGVPYDGVLIRWESEAFTFLGARLTLRADSPWYAPGFLEVNGSINGESFQWLCLGTEVESGSIISN